MKVIHHRAATANYSMCQEFSDLRGCAREALRYPTVMIPFYFEATKHALHGEFFKQLPRRFVPCLKRQS